MHYSLECLATGATLTDTDLPLTNPAAPEPALLRTRYRKRTFTPGSWSRGIYRFADWLPVHRSLRGSSAPVTYRSEGLARHLGLENLFVTFSGYWPERGVRMMTGTFKECEAFCVCARMPFPQSRILVVSSAGNTARAFIRVCSENNIPLVVVTPERNVPAVWSISPVSDNVRFITAGGDSDYTDAIILGDIIASLPGFIAEGGAKNVARRDGMGTTMLSAAEVIGEIPTHYFQAVGSGTGAIAAWEANLRLLKSGGFGTRKARLHLSQNVPFTPIHNAWQSKSRHLFPMDVEDARSRIASIGAKVLANRTPPYSVVGGLFDALSDTNGTTGAITNEAAAHGAALFLDLEGIDLEPAAAVAVAHLVESAAAGNVSPTEPVMLNVTGGGYARVHADESVLPVTPSLTIDRKHFTREAVHDAITSLFPHLAAEPASELALEEGDETLQLLRDDADTANELIGRRVEPLDSTAARGLKGLARR